MKRIELVKMNSSMLKIMAKNDIKTTDVSFIEEQGSFVRDLGANVTGNVIYGGATWLLGRLLRAIK